MHDAFLDGYHIKFAHPNSAGRVIHTNTYVVEDYERHARFISPRKSLDGWLEHDPGEDEQMVEHVMLTHFIGPNCTLLQLPDNFQVLTFYPVSDDPFESHMEMRLLVPPREQSGLDEEAWKAKWDKNWYILQKVLAGEDFPILRGIQKAYGNEVSTPTVLGRNEILNQAFHREIAHLRAATPDHGSLRSSSIVGPIGADLKDRTVVNLSSDATASRQSRAAPTTRAGHPDLRPAATVRHRRPGWASRRGSGGRPRRRRPCRG